MSQKFDYQVLHLKFLFLLRALYEQQDHVEEFIKAFNEEMTRLQKERGSGREQKTKELAQIDKKLEGLYDAIADGLRTQGLKVRLVELEGQKETLKAEIEVSPELAPSIHPNLSELYRSKIEHLHDSLNQNDTRTEAAETLRSLVEHIEVKNTDDGIEIKLEGQIVNMIQTAQSQAHKGKHASNEAAFLKKHASSVKVVAGVGFEPTTFRL